MRQDTPFQLPRRSPFGIGEYFAEKATGLQQLSRLYTQKPVDCDTQEFLRFTLDVLGIDYQVASGNTAHIPTSDATVVVANHPLGCIEGVILAELLCRIRSDVQILANHYLKTIPELSDLFIAVDVFETQSATTVNSKAIRQAHTHLKQGGLLLIFPAGEVSHRNDKQLIEDKEWSRSVANLVKRSKATTLPIYIEAENSRRFYSAGKIHPLLRTMMLGREMLNKRGQPIKLHIGQQIRFKEIANLSSQEIVSYLRLNTDLLRPQDALTNLNSTSIAFGGDPIEKARPKSIQLAEISRLPKETRLLESGDFEVFCCRAELIPNLLHEIGRLREINFRQVGEGTGRALDLDKYDVSYQHLFIWDRQNQCLAGAYRLGLVDHLIQRHGLNGLYSRTLFNYDKRFLEHMGPSLEMGRSVIAKEYQKSMSALLLLWKGIATYVAKNPHITHLFGPVSISGDYSEKAKQLMADTLSLNHGDHVGSKLVEAPNPIDSQTTAWKADMLTALADVNLLSRVIGRMESGKGVPVLLRQYLGLNGKLVSFNIDPDFNNCLDGLIVVDMRGVEKRTLARYMGSEPARQYLDLHKR